MDGRIFHASCLIYVCVSESQNLVMGIRMYPRQKVQNSDYDRGGFHNDTPLRYLQSFCHTLTVGVNCKFEVDSIVEGIVHDPLG